jgi:glycosyltransferase involved in cell wall biosynthesis
MEKFKVLFLSSIPIYPPGGGGGGLSAYYLIDSLRRLNWQFEIICQHKELLTLRTGNPQRLSSKIISGIYYIAKHFFAAPRFRLEESEGLKIWMGNVRCLRAKNFIKKKILETQPNLIIGQFFSRIYDIENLYFAATRGFFTICFLRSMNVFEIARRNWPDNICYIANSKYVAEIAQNFLKKPVDFICPFIDKEQVISSKKNPSYILFINPLMGKGVDIFIQIAKRMPNQKFLALKGDWFFIDYTAETIYTKAIKALSNVTLLEVQKPEDMSKIYGQTKILLQLARHKETFSRIILEAHYNGIPVVAANNGAIPWTMGEGDKVDAYVEALNRLCNDDVLYRQYSDKALKNSERPEFQIENSTKKLISIVQNNIEATRDLSVTSSFDRFLFSKIQRLISKLKTIAIFIPRLLLGQIRIEFARALWRNHRLSEGSLWMSIFTTARCTKNCEECIMGPLRTEFSDYQMSIGEIKHFIEVSEKSHYRFDLILTGGEPLCWDHFREGIKLLKGSRICNSIHLFTNALDISKLDAEIVGFLDRIRISRYSVNANNIERLIELFGNKVEVVDRRKFWKNPTHPLPNTVPPICCNPEIFLFNNKVYACAHSASISFTSKSKTDLCNPLEVGFISGLDRIRKRQERGICDFCISNLKVRRQVEEEPSV